DTLFYTKINKNVIMPKYLYYLLCTIGLERYSEGAAVPSLTTKTLYEIELNIPNMNIQQHIVNTILSHFFF
ncbi:restriction endonuclease subunit S, partial [Metamycoplasma equirhinis]